MTRDQRIVDLGWRIAVTVALVYGIHFATNVVRETYPAVTLADSGTFRVDPYLGLHPDLFDFPGRGAFINNNPGASILGSAPYALAKPAFDALFRRYPSLIAPKPPATYDDPRPNRTRFMNEARARGVDVKLGLAAASMHSWLMVPLAALSVVVMFRLLLGRLGDTRLACLLALLYAFATPVFFRSAFLNQNLLMGHAVFFAFAPLRGFGPTPKPLTTRSLLAAGALLGLGIVCDYSGASMALAFGLWVMAVGWSDRRSPWQAVKAGGYLLVGALPVLAVLWGYQAAAFGNPWLPAQAYMPSTELSHLGWFGFLPPQAHLLWGNLFDLRYGLLAFSPLLVLGLAAPLLRSGRGLPRPREQWLIFGSVAALYLFSSSVAYAGLQWNTGVRYMVPAAPLLFQGAVPVLLRLPRFWLWLAVIPTVTISWSVSMTREAVPVSLARTFLKGFELPWLTVLEKMASGYAPFLGQGTSPLPLFLLVGVVLWLIWRGAPLAASRS